MDEKLAYVTRRTNANGKVRWYWQRPGHKLRRLPDDPVERFREAKRLNDAAIIRPHTDFHWWPRPTEPS